MIDIVTLHCNLCNVTLGFVILFWSEHGSLIMVSVVMLFLKMVDYHVFFPLMSTLTDLLKLSLNMFYVIMLDYPCSSL